MAERISRAGQTHSMELIFFPLIILVLVGLISNAFSSSAIQTVPVLPTPFCTGNIEPGECYPTNLNGCDQNVTPNCQFTAKTQFSFLNSNSPFTFLLQGNIIGFLSSTFNSGEIPNRISAGYSICIPLINNKYANESNTNPDIHNFECLSQTATGNASVPPIFPQTGVPMNATSNGGNNSQWSITGCNLVNNNYPCFLNSTEPADGFQAWNGSNSQMSFYGFYVKNGTTITATSGCTIYGSVSACRTLMPWLFHTNPSFTCPSTNHVNGIHINSTSYFCLLPTVNPSTATTSLPNSFSGLSFLFGVLLFFLGLGFSLTSAIIGFSINEQGTKIAQVMGIGILVWSFIFGEFGGWLSFLPFNLGTIGFLLFTMMFFLGLYWRTFSNFD